MEGKLTIGREAEFRLTDATVSRMHAAITPTQDGRAVLEDLGSSGGTMVNGSRISGPVFLSGGERIQVGTNVLELVVPAAPAAGSPTIAIPTSTPTVMQPVPQPPAPAPAPPPTPSPFDPPTFAQPPAVPAGLVAPPAPAIPFQPPPPAQPPAPAKRNRTRLVIAALVGLVVIAAAIVLLTRGGDEAPAAGGGGKDQVTVTVNPGDANTVTNLKAAVGDLTADPATWIVTLTWDDAPASLGLDHYEVTRDGKVIVANDPQPTFEDDGVSPGQVFMYSVIAIGKNGKTDPAEIEVTTPGLPIADAHVDGTWVVSLTVTKSNLNDIGQTVMQRWSFAPSCAFGSCDVVWTVQGKSVTGAIRADGENYEGTANAPFLIKSCKNQVIDETLALKFTVQKTQVAAREFAAAALRGTLTEVASAPGCKTSTRTFDFTALRA